MPKTASLDQELKRFAALAPAGSNSGFIKTFKDGLEVETKADIRSSAEVRRVLKDIGRLGITKTEYRSENHRLHDVGDGSHACVIKVKGLSAPWVKTKSANRVAHTDKLGLPLVTRFGRKFKPGEKGYPAALRRTERAPKIASFHKDCINVFFTYRGHLFSLSFSLAKNRSGFVHRQMEFEYEGHPKGEPAPSQAKIKRLLERLFTDELPYLIGGLNARTKFEILTTEAKHRL